MQTIRFLFLTIIICFVSCRPEPKLTFKQRFDKLKTLPLPIVLTDVRDITKYIDNTNWVWDSSVVGHNIIPIGFIKRTSTHYTIIFDRQKANSTFIATFDTSGNFIDSVALHIGDFIEMGDTAHFISYKITADTLEKEGYILHPKLNPIGEEPIDTLFFSQGNIITFAGRD